MGNSVNKMSYFFNAILYIMWKKQFGFHIITFNIIICLLIIIWSVFPKCKYKLIKRYLTGKRSHYIVVSNVDSGINIQQARNWMAVIITIYAMSVGLPIICVGTNCKFNISENAAFLIPASLLYLGVYILVDYKDNYKKYFDIFSYCGESWHKRWERNMWFFCIGSIICLYVSSFICLLIF